MDKKNPDHLAPVIDFKTRKEIHIDPEGDLMDVIEDELRHSKEVFQKDLKERLERLTEISDARELLMRSPLFREDKYQAYCRLARTDEASEFAVEERTLYKRVRVLESNWKAVIQVFMDHIVQSLVMSEECLLKLTSKYPGEHIEEERLLKNRVEVFKSLHLETFSDADISKKALDRLRSLIPRFDALQHRSWE